jgi:hypothetical protein
VALAALEPHFARALCQVAGLAPDAFQDMRASDTHSQLAQWLQGQSRQALEALAVAHDLPLLTLP